MVLKSFEQIIPVDINQLVQGARRHASRMGYLKVGLLIVTAILVVTLIALPFFSPLKQGIQIDIGSGTLTASEVDTSGDMPMMLNPRFYGVDKEGKPFQIVAKDAQQKTPDVIIVNNVEGEILRHPSNEPNAQDSWVALRSARGEIQVKQKQLLLSGGVSVHTSEGYEMDTQSAWIILEEGVAKSDEPVTVQGLPGALKAQGFSLEDRGNIINFTGPVSLTIYPESMRRMK